MTGHARPFGWARIVVCDTHGRERVTWREDRLDPVECEHIRQAAAAVLDGATVEEIARRWNRPGGPEPVRGRGLGWRGRIVHHILVSPRVAGLVQAPPLDADERRYPKPLPDDEGAPVAGQWPAIVDVQTWERCRAVLRGRGRPGQREPRQRSLLTGMLVCECGRPMFRSYRVFAGRHYVYWRCRNDEGSPGCGQNSIAAAATDALPDQEAEVSNVEQLVLGTMLRRFDRTELAALGLAAQFAGKPGALRTAWERLTMGQKQEMVRAAWGQGKIRIARPPKRRQHFDPRRVTGIFSGFV